MLTVVASILVFAALLGIVAAVVFVVGQALGRLSRAGRAPRTVVRRPTSPQPPSFRSPSFRSPSSGPPPFGSLPGLDRPVGALGDPAPDADLSSDASEHDIYGE